MKGILQISLLALLSLTACTKTEYVDIDVNPRLEIHIVDADGASVSDAVVKLYITEDDFLQDENEQSAEYTDHEGKVTFEDLSEIVYFFYASKSEKNNFYEVVSFDTPLEMNEIRVITSVIR